MITFACQCWYYYYTPCVSISHTSLRLTHSLILRMSSDGILFGIYRSVGPIRLILLQFVECNPFFVINISYQQFLEQPVLSDADENMESQLLSSSRLSMSNVSQPARSSSADPRRSATPRSVESFGHRSAASFDPSPHANNLKEEDDLIIIIITISLLLFLLPLTL